MTLTEAGATTTRSENVSPLAGTPVRELSPAAIAEREAFRAYVDEEAEPWYRENLGRLFTLWDEWNAQYFAGAMVTPHLLLTQPSEPKRYGDCGPTSGWGSKSQIRIRPSLLDGTHPHMVRGTRNPEGRFRFVADILLHEMIHQWQQEISGQTDDGYHGHGPAFRNQCIRIGAVIGLPPVRTGKKRGKDAGLPSCSQWPHNVRPEAHYLGAYVPPRDLDDDAPSIPETITVPTDPAAMVEGLARVLTAAEAYDVARGLVAHFDITLSCGATVSTSGDISVSREAVRIRGIVEALDRGHGAVGGQQDDVRGAA
jgi:hypothetical protein